MTDREVEKLIEEFHVPRHVRRHCKAVANFAVSLGEQFIKKGIPVALETLRHAALLHDLVRVVDFKDFNPDTFPDPATQEEIEFWKELRFKYAGLHHAEAAGRILDEKGEHTLAKIVRSHNYLHIKDGFNSWEEKLLYYADKRAKHDSIVPLKERLLDGRKRNAPETINTKEAEELDFKVLELEKEILKIAQAL